MPLSHAQQEFLHSPLMAILLMLISTFFDAVLLACVRYLSQEIHPFQLAFMRSLFGVVVMLPLFLAHGRAPLRTPQLGLHGLRACTNVVGMMLFFSALSLIPMPKAQALLFTAPLFATVLAVVILGEVIRFRRLSAVVIGFIGALVVIRPGVGPLEPGALLALAAAGFWGSTLILVKLLSRRDSAITVTLYMVILMTPLSLLPALTVWRPMDLTQLGIIAFGALVGTVGQLAMAQSFKMADITVVLPFDFTKLIWGSLLVYFLFGETMDSWGWVGAIVIFSASFYVAYRERRVKSRRADL